MIDLGDSSLKLMALVLGSACYRNSLLEGLHRGPFPESDTGDNSDIRVVGPHGEVPWNQVSRFDDREMKDLMKKVVDRLYTCLRVALIEDLDAEKSDWLISRHSKMAANWDEPKIDEGIFKSVEFQSPTSK